MGKLQKKLRLFKRKRRHVRYLETSIWHLKYEILNDALVLKVNENKVNLVLAAKNFPMAIFLKKYSKSKFKLFLREAVDPFVAVKNQRFYIFRKFIIYLKKKLYPSADKIIAISEGVKKTLVNEFKIKANKIDVIYNPAADHRILEMAKEKVEENYLDKEAPDLHIALFDIEVDFDKDRGFARPDDPHQRITAISVHLSWLDSLITLCLAPKDMPFEMADSIAKKFDNTVLCETEAQLLNTFLHLIEDADILSGWNSEGFDIPYTVNRTIQVLGKSETRKLCLWDQFPKERRYSKFRKMGVYGEFVLSHTTPWRRA